MISQNQCKQFYEALLNKNAEFEGVFWVGVKTTGIFCRPTCPARKPKFENCEFFKTAEDALLASFRPCQRCRPLSHPDEVSPLVAKLVQAVEENPEKRWKDRDFKVLSVDASTARRQFKKRFGMTFVQYARARRMGIAMKEIRSGQSVLEAQLNAGYESASGFRDAFSKIMGMAPKGKDQINTLKASWLDSPLGPIVVISDDKALYLLEFVTRRGLEREIEKLRIKTKSAIIPGETPVIESIKKELELYFNGVLTEFKTPIKMIGTPFQQAVWCALMQIPYGQTCSYKDLAEKIGNPKGCRAVAQANGSNQLAIIIPCHRVINANGDIGGYGGGVFRKEQLLCLEKNS